MKVGDELETVLVGCLLGDHLRIWTTDGKGQMLRLHESADLVGVLANGVVARTSPEERRFREVLLLEARSHTLVALDRRPQQVKEASVAMHLRTFKFEPVSELTPDNELWGIAAAWIGHALLAAALRGEFLVVERGAWEMIPDPYAFACTVRKEVGWVATVEASPAPRTSGWPHSDPGLAGQTITAPATRDTLLAAGQLIVEAVAVWARSPFDVVLTYGANPDGPLDPALAVVDRA